MSKRNKVIRVIVIALLLLGFFWFENNHLQTSFYEYESDRVPTEYDGFRIVQISDLHNACFGRENNWLTDKVKECGPDIIVVTGDVIDSDHTRMDVALDCMESMAEICPVYYITGNHEYWIDESTRMTLLSELVDRGVIVLMSEATTITRGEEVIRIVGLDDSRIASKDLQNLMRENEDNPFTILLAHEPTYIRWYAQNEPDIVLAGHEHGGQFRLPFLGPVYAPDQGFWPDLTEGVYTEGNTTMYISRGLGNSAIPIRLFNDPEILCLDLKTAK